MLYKCFAQPQKEDSIYLLKVETCAHVCTGLGFRHSFASMAVSLPPGLDYQHSSTNPVLSPTCSSFVSREDLQCNWQDLPKFNIEPIEEMELVKRPSQDIEDTTGEIYTTHTKKPLNLSSLFMHQVGRKLNQYKSLIAKSSSKKNLSNVASFVSMGSAATRDPIG